MRYSKKTKLDAIGLSLQGLTNTEIANVLGKDPATITHVVNDTLMGGSDAESLARRLDNLEEWRRSMTRLIARLTGDRSSVINRLDNRRTKSA